MQDIVAVLTSTPSPLWLLIGWVFLSFYMLRWVLRHTAMREERLIKVNEGWQTAFAEHREVLLQLKNSLEKLSDRVERLERVIEDGGGI